ncbi:MAG TPA: LamG domain-containing protein [Planctomycetota bacterium]|nr:LamG domain-containing protein [Planctomycetota bacterium]
MNFKLAASLALVVVCAQDPAPVLHLKFDDQKVDDGAKALGKVEFGEGKHGGALKLDGSGGHVELASTEALDKLQADSYTVAAWFKPEIVPPGTESANDARFGIVIKAGWHTGLSYNNEKQFVMEHWLAPAAGGEEPVWAGAGTWEDSNDAGKWYHVAGVVDRKAGSTKLYVNGELKNSADWEAGKAARDPGKQPWRVGIGSPGAEKWSWPAKGLIDDVRLYNKALAEAEVAALYKGTAK